ncbi:MAG: sulfite exporter TauE/SafE family protein [Rhodospirillales bacterium]|nr:sulfite exporter TauE/SafE family protein [Rhodospirillales bacterium]
MDLVMYWFMFPVSILVATTAMLSGIGGAAYFMPIFIIIFPMLGPEYPLASPVAAIGVALLTETFGFSSGFVGYFRKRLIDFKVARSFLVFSVPAAIAGALLSHLTDSNLLLMGYGALMLILTVVLFRGHEVEIDATNGNNDKAPYRSRHQTQPHSTTARNGDVFQYHFHRPRGGSIPLATGGFLTGILSVGIGEVVMPLLVKRYRIPVPVAAATSILVVIITVMSASFTHISTLIAEGGVNAVPWNLVMYTIPAVIIGGQIGPRLQGVVPSRTMEKVIASLFFIIGIAMLWIVFKPFIGT